MKSIKSSLFLTLLLTFFIFQSCSNECSDVICQNGGSCLEGLCDCPVGYDGTNCEIFDLSQVQTLLSNHSPLELFNGGIPLDSLYGKIYENGYIFYLDTNTGSGMVAAIEDQGVDIEWGCDGTDISGLPNITSDPPPNLETEEGARIGDGATNTTAILVECKEEGRAARLCRDLGAEWFLPSRGELNLMYTNLKENGHGGFAEEFYWSSTEESSFAAWFKGFIFGIETGSGKVLNFNVRAVKTF